MSHEVEFGRILTKLSKFVGLLSKDRQTAYWQSLAYALAVTDDRLQKHSLITTQIERAQKEFAENVVPVSNQPEA